MATTAGPALSAGDWLKITVYAKGSHGSMPHMAVDPVVLASSIVLRLHRFVSRETKPCDLAVAICALNAEPNRTASPTSPTYC